MRQSIVLERDEMEMLKRGEPLRLTVGGQTIELMFELIRRPRQDADAFRGGFATHGQALLETIGENPGLTPKQLAPILGKKPIAIYDYIYKLRKDGKIAKDKNGGWFIANGNGRPLKAVARNGK